MRRHLWRSNPLAARLSGLLAVRSSAANSRARSSPPALRRANFVAFGSDFRSFAIFVVILRARAPLCGGQEAGLLVNVQVSILLEGFGGLHIPEEVSTTEDLAGAGNLGDGSGCGLREVGDFA